MVTLNFLSADRPLTKSYIVKSDGSYESTPYPLTAAFTSHAETANDIEEFYVHLAAHAQAGHCLLKGTLQRPLTRESRAGLTASTTTQWLCLDFDGIDLQERTVEDLLVEIGVGKVDHIIQYSASHGIKPGFSAHIIVLLEKPVAPEMLKQFLKWRNLTVPFLREQIALTKTGMSLHWPLDISVADNSRLLYITPPAISGVPDPVPVRTVLVKSLARTMSFSLAPPGLDIQAADLIRQLRSAQGLPDHKGALKFDKKVKLEVMTNPERVSVTGVKYDGDFTRVNINGGVSWGYYHVAATPEVLYNFRGEPNYLLRDICPEYYQEAQDNAKNLKAKAHLPTDLDQTAKHWVINHKAEGKYYKVTYEPETGLELDPAPSLKHISDWCQNRKIPTPEAIEDWDILFNPTTTQIINAEKKWVNTFRPTKFRLHAQVNSYKELSEKPDPRSPLPKEYLLLIKHVCGGDNEAAYRFVNWLAYIWQTGNRAKTAWLFHGTYGTGKGRLLRVLKFLFGEHCISTGPEGMEDKFNEHLERAQIVWLDELTTDSWDSARMTPKLRNLIDGEVALRAMRKGWQQMEPYFGLIIAANEHNSVEIRARDRRFNVAPRQEQNLRSVAWLPDGDAVLDDYRGSLYQDNNLQAFANALLSYEVDVAAVLKPLDNEAKAAVMRVTQSLPEDIVQALDVGEVSFFVGYVPPQGTVLNLDTTEYKRVVEKMLRGGKIALSLKELSVIFEFIAGWKNAAGKFTKALSKYGIDLRGKTAREGNRTFAGTYFYFNVTDEDRFNWSQTVENKLEVVREPRVAEN